MTNLSFSVLWNGSAAQRGMQNLGKATDKTHASFRALKVGAGLALVAATGAAVKFGTSSVKAYVEAQTAQVRLQDAFAKFPKLADTNIGSLRKLNTQLALKTKFDDDATASGQAVLAQFGLTGQQLTKLTPLLQDYAAKTGKDLPAAAGVLGKAFLGNTRALKAIGIDYKMTGDKGKDFANIQRLVNEKVGGFAAKEGKSAAGQAAILRNQFGELQESAGKQLLPALLKVGQGLLRLVGFVQSNSAIFGTFGKTVKTIFSSIAESIGLGKVSFKSFSDFISTHQADITSGIITGGKAFIGFGKILATVAKVGLQAFAFLADSQANMLEQMLGGFGLITRGAALAFGWLPGVGANFKRADVAFRGFAAGAVGGLRGAAAGARSLADGVDKKLLPGLNKAGQSLDALGKKEIASARNRDIMARAEIGHRRAIDAATAASKTNGRTLDSNTVSGRANRTALNNLVSSSQNYIAKLNATGASSKRVTSATQSARDEFVRVARQMGVSRDRARELAAAYFKIPGKRSTNVGVKFSSSGSVSLRTGGAKYIANATGGVLPGFTPGRDVHRFQSKSPGVPDLALSGGEAIMRPEWTRAVGGPKAVARMNRDAKQGKVTALADGGTLSFAGAGTIPSMSRATTGAYRVSEDAGKAVAKLAAAAVVKAAMAALRKQAAAAAAKAAASSAAGYSGPLPGGRGAAGIRAIARALGASYIAHHIDPQGGNAYDLGSSGARNRRIGNALVSAHGRLGLRYVIRQMQIASARSSWNWRGYHPITGSGDFRHVNHVHVSYDRGGLLRPGGLAINTGRGPERILTTHQTRSYDNLVRAVSRNGGGAGNTTIILNAPNWVGSRSEMKQLLVDMARGGDFNVVLDRAGIKR